MTEDTPAMQDSVQPKSRQPKQEKSGKQLLGSVLLSLAVLLGTLWSSYHSTSTLPMVQQYHAEQTYDMYDTGQPQVHCFAICRNTYRNETKAQDPAQVFINMVWKLDCMLKYVTTDRGPEFNSKCVAHILLVTILGGCTVLLDTLWIQCCGGIQITCYAVAALLGASKLA